MDNFFGFFSDMKELELVNSIRSLSPYAFEQYVADCFAGWGFDVEQTPPTNDGGKDIILRKDGKTYYVECKHFSEGLVGREIIQKLVGAGVIDGNVNGYVVVASSGFNSNAIECAKKNDKIFLIDLLNLVRLSPGGLKGAIDYNINNINLISSVSAPNGHKLDMSVLVHDDSSCECDLYLKDLYKGRTMGGVIIPSAAANDVSQSIMIALNCVQRYQKKIAAIKHTEKSQPTCRKRNLDIRRAGLYRNNWNHK